MRWTPFNRRVVRPRTGPTAAAGVLLAALVVPVLVLGGCSWSDDDATPTPTTLRPPDEMDIAYGPATGCGEVDADCGGSQELDIYRSPRPGPNPVMVWLHGGGGVAGDKAQEVPEDLEAFLDDGWDIVSANYRLATEAGANRFPTGLLDAKRAVRWVKANAAAQDWDPTRVAAAGHSMGANLVQLLATTAGDPGLEPTGLPADLAAQDSSITEGVALAPVSDLATFNQAGWMGMSVDQYLGCSVTCPELMAQASVPAHVTPAAAPLVAVHGALDPWAAPAQGEAVQAAYERAGIGDRFLLLVISDGPENAQGHTPDLARAIDEVREFLARG